MTSALNLKSSDPVFKGQQLCAISDPLPDILEVSRYFPPEKLDPEQRIELGVRFLEQYGETHFFFFFQYTYRLTKEEFDRIVLSAENYVKDLVTWDVLDESAYKEEAALIRNSFPAATFYLLQNRAGNHRELPIVEIEGKRYMFYSCVSKGPKVDQEYVEQYAACQTQECRPNFTCFSKEGMTLFLMEFISEKTPDFRDRSHLELLMGLITCFSLNKKALDFLPCRLAIKDQKMYCVDPKILYFSYETVLEAFRENICSLKSIIENRGYAEETDLLDYVDSLADKHFGKIFEKTLECLPSGFRLKEEIPPELLDADQKVQLAAAYLKRNSPIDGGTVILPYIAATYNLSIENQNKAKTLAGSELIDNTVFWKDEINPLFETLYQRALTVLQKEGIEGKFATYCNHVGNHKMVLTVTIEEDVFVVSEVSQEYIENYQRCQARQHRPNFSTFPMQDGQFLFLAHFMGSQTVDYSNPEHLALIVDLAMHFSGDEPNGIDFNLGNLLVEKGQLYYIDKDLYFSTPKNPRLENLKGIFRAIDATLHTEKERAESKRIVKEQLKLLLNPENLQDAEILNIFFSNIQRQTKIIFV